MLPFAIVFPFSDRLKILKSLPFELEEDFPFSPDSAIYDARVVRYLGSSAEVLACAAPGIRVKEALDVARDGAFELNFLAAEGLSYANLWTNWAGVPGNLPNPNFANEDEARPERTIDLYVHLGDQRTLVCAVEDEALAGVRSLFWGGLNLAQAIAKKYEITLTEAKTIAQSRAFVLLNQDNAAYDQIVFSETIAESLRELAHDLKMTVLEFQNEFNGRVRNISLTGGTSQVQNIHAYLTQALEAPVNLATAFTGVIETSFQVDAHADAVGAVALGFALEGLRRPRNPALNFMKGEFQKQNRRLQIFWANWGSLVQTGAIILVLFFIYAFVRENITESLNDSSLETLKDQAKKVAHLGSKQATDTGIQKYILEQRKQSQETRAAVALAKLPSALDWLAKISDSVPGRTNLPVHFNRFSVHDNRIEIDGAVVRSSDVAAIQKALIPLSSDGKVEITSQPRVYGKEYIFSMAMSIDRGSVRSEKK